MAFAELETTERTLELLRDALNARLKAPKALHYKNFAWRDPHGGRAICTGVIRACPSSPTRAPLHGHRLRILEVHVTVNEHDLTIVASHWTSRVSDKSGDGRDKYGDQIYEVYKSLYHPIRTSTSWCAATSTIRRTTTASSSTCTPWARRKATWTASRSRARTNRLYNLMAHIDHFEHFTHYYSGQKYIFDQIAVSPALLDGQGGWSCDPKTVEIVANEMTTEKRPRIPVPIPHRFGNPNDKFERGCSDHLPVTVRSRLGSDRLRLAARLWRALTLDVAGVSRRNEARSPPCDRSFPYRRRRNPGRDRLLDGGVFRRLHLGQREELIVKVASNCVTRKRPSPWRRSGGSTRTSSRPTAC